MTSAQISFVRHNHHRPVRCLLLPLVTSPWPIVPLLSLKLLQVSRLLQASVNSIFFLSAYIYLSIYLSILIVIFRFSFYFASPFQFLSFFSLTPSSLSSSFSSFFFISVALFTSSLFLFLLRVFSSRSLLPLPFCFSSFSLSIPSFILHPPSSSSSCFFVVVILVYIWPFFNFPISFKSDEGGDGGGECDVSAREEVHPIPLRRDRNHLSNHPRTEAVYRLTPLPNSCLLKPIHNARKNLPPLPTLQI
ncbi:OLFR [Acanthosepion pharaonis]|uniref:OLFR n=1 Tax=Acanthosepion pharaonis TaxID=158019 RepID=A0A812CNQ5_ACAPH|nr:OLFR [Sepia pharaonis]